MYLIYSYSIIFTDILSVPLGLGSEIIWSSGTLKAWDRLGNATAATAPLGLRFHRGAVAEKTWARHRLRGSSENLPERCGNIGFPNGHRHKNHNHIADHDLAALLSEYSIWMYLDYVQIFVSERELTGPYKYLILCIRQPKYKGIMNMSRGQYCNLIDWAVLPCF